MIYSVSPELYRESAERLIEAIGTANYFSGSVSFALDGVECLLRASLIVYRREHSLPEGRVDAVADLVPVWWEFHTIVEGTERLNDFDLGEMKHYL